MNVGLMFSFRNPPKWKKPWEDVYEAQRKRLLDVVRSVDATKVEEYRAERDYEGLELYIVGKLMGR